MQPLQGGGAFIRWGGLQPYFTEFGDRGRPVFDARFVAAGVESYRAYLQPWSADAPGAPGVTADDDSTGTRLRLSWNGATAVSSRRVQAGEVHSATAARTGFETTIALPGHPRARGRRGT